MIYGFSYMGFLFVAFLLAPSFYWVNLPEYAAYHSRKKWLFSALDRMGLTAMICVTLIFRNYDFRGPEPWAIFLALAWIFLLLYSLHWAWCLWKKRTPLVLGRIPMTVLPVLVFLFLGIYGRSPWLLLALIPYAIGHTGGMTDSPGENPACPCCSGGSCDLSKKNQG